MGKDKTSLNSISDKDQTKMNDKAARILKQIIDLVKEGLQKIKSTKRQIGLENLTSKEVLEVKARILDQILLWILEDKILNVLLTQAPRYTFQALEQLFDESIYDTSAVSKIKIFNKN